MARVLTYYAKPGPNGESTRIYELGTQEAGGTATQARVGILILYKDKYDALTAGEKTAFGAQTIDTLVTMAGGYYALTEL